MNYKPDEVIMKLIRGDSINEKIWNEALQEAEKSKKV